VAGSIPVPSNLFFLNKELGLVTTKIRFKNNCQSCLFLGQYMQYDLYFCISVSVPVYITDGDYSKSEEYPNVFTEEPFKEIMNRAIKFRNIRERIELFIDRTGDSKSLSLYNDMLESIQGEDIDKDYPIHSERERLL
jgi:hypothetical protein